MRTYNITHLKQLESEAIFVMRETAAQFERPALAPWRRELARVLDQARGVH